VDKFKSVFSSRTIIANAVTFLASIGTIWGLDLTPENQAIAVSVIVALGTAASSFFRKEADTKLTTTPAKAEEANLRADAAMEVAKSIGQPKPPPSMPVALLLGAFLLTSLLGGCVTSRQPVVVTPGVTTPTKIDIAINTGSQEINKYCTAIQLGLNLIHTFVVRDPNHQTVVEYARTGFEAYCANPPGDVASALDFLKDAYTRIVNVQRSAAARRAVRAAAGRA
jgi:hypothetical protein